MKNLAFLTFVILLFYACAITDEPEGLIRESPSKIYSEQLPIPVWSIDELLGSKFISNGFVIDPNGFGSTFINNNPVCHADYSQTQFERFHLDANSKDGLYRSKNGSLIYLQDNIISRVKILKNCVERYVFRQRPDCDGFGPIRYTILECYSPGGHLLSRDTTERKFGDCINITPELDFFFEDEYGNKIPNPLCL